MNLARMMLRMLLLVAGLGGLASACAETNDEKPNPTIIKPAPEADVEKGGIPPDKMAEVQLYVQQREPTARKCYQDVLNEKHSRAFQGDIRLVMTLAPQGEISKATSIKILGGSLSTEKEITDCLIEKINEWEFPKLDRKGDFTYQYRFAPQY